MFMIIKRKDEFNSKRVTIEEKWNLYFDRNNNGKKKSRKNDDKKIWDFKNEKQCLKIKFILKCGKGENTKRKIIWK